MLLVGTSAYASYDVSATPIPPVATATPQPTPTLVPTATPRPTDTPQPTATPANTAVPTATAMPTATPPAYSLQSAADQACATTCGASRCIFGQDTSNNHVTDCADANADLCTCSP